MIEHLWSTEAHTSAKLATTIQVAWFNDMTICMNRQESIRCIVLYFLWTSPQREMNFQLRENAGPNTTLDEHWLSV